jgi:hypothetical protein
MDTSSGAVAPTKVSIDTSAALANTPQREALGRLGRPLIATFRRAPPWSPPASTTSNQEWPGWSMKPMTRVI